MHNIIQNVLDPVLTLIYPPKCCVCKLMGEEGLCSKCISAFPTVPEPVCNCCGQPLGDAPACSHCAHRAPMFTHLRSMGLYEGALEIAIHHFKYRDKPNLARPLGKLLAEYAISQKSVLNHLKFDAIIPSPMHPKRKRLRGYNQAERLAMVLGEELELPCSTQVLMRSKYTRPQVGLDQSCRQSNLKDSFTIAPGVSVDGLVYLIVDDVTTTGSTIYEGARVLKSAGAKSVYGLTLAVG